MKILITGGCGFIGSTLALYLNAISDMKVICLDNLSRHGSEYILYERLLKSNIEYIHGDVRNPEDLKKIKQNIDIIIECSAESSIMAGYEEFPIKTINTNIQGVWNCLELARQFKSAFIFLSSSRVYPYDYLRKLPLIESDTRFILCNFDKFQGVSTEGISEDFPIIDGCRSLYGTTKLCSELLVHEFGRLYDFKTIVNRCGIIAGPWQMGKIDQGLVTFWLLKHFKKEALQYMGISRVLEKQSTIQYVYGKQVRDVLHVNDLCSLIYREIRKFDECSGDTFNIGGGIKNTLSLYELTNICTQLLGATQITNAKNIERYADIPLYISDFTKASKKLLWQPTIPVSTTLVDTCHWIKNHYHNLKHIL